MRNPFQPWTWLAPVLAWLLILGSFAATIPVVILIAALVASVLAAVHHAELVAHRVGEPFGTFLLAIAVTVIELGLIITLMAAAGEGAATLARDTVFAAVMIILNGLVGICIFIGALRHKEQIFQQTGVSASLATICALTTLTLVLPNFTLSEPGPGLLAGAAGVRRRGFIPAVCDVRRSSDGSPPGLFLAG
jgi:Ca2+:H+ antiporter